MHMHIPLDAASAPAIPGLLCGVNRTIGRIRSDDIDASIPPMCSLLEISLELTNAIVVISEYSAFWAVGADEPGQSPLSARFVAS
jgi:hypothetical protein